MVRIEFDGNQPTNQLANFLGTMSEFESFQVAVLEQAV
jgi:hypothetical protein